MLERNRKRQTRAKKHNKQQEEKLKSAMTNSGNHIMRHPGERVKVWGIERQAL